MQVRKNWGTFELSFESKQIEVSKSPVKVEVGEGKKEEKKKKEEPLEEGACPYCRKKHIDLTSKMTFQNQKDSTGCARTSKAIINGTIIRESKDKEELITLDKLKKL